MDSEGRERVRNEGYLPKVEFRAWLDMSLARLAFAAKKWNEAERKFDAVVSKYPDSGVAAYSVYWRGVSRYKETKDDTALSAVTEEFRHKYRDSIWAKKAVVWGN